MNKAVINSIRDKILADVPELTTVLMWNNQQANDLTRDERAFNYPVAFIGFDTPAIYETTRSKVQDGELEVSIRICDEFHDEYSGASALNLDIFDLKQKVFVSLQGHQDSPNHTAMTRTSEEIDDSHDAVYVFIQRYSFRLLDCEKYDNDYDLTTIDTVTINPELNIENDIIRTAKNPE